MSVFYDNHGRDSDFENHGDESLPRARWRPFDSRRQPPPRRDRADAPLSGLSYERAEGVIQLVLAFALVGGATAVLNSSLFGSPARAPVKAAAVSTPAPLPPPKAAAPPPAQAAPVSAPSAPVAAPPPTQSVAAGPVQAAPAPAAPSHAASVPASFFDARPIADRVSMEPEPAPQPLAPPSPEAREKLAVQSAPPPPAGIAAVEATAPEARAAPSRAASAETGAADNGRLTKCYLKIAGKRHENSDCRIRQSDNEVVFEFADKTLTFVHQHGRVWNATMGGRSFGAVSQDPRKPCWGVRGSGFFACDNT